MELFCPNFKILQTSVQGFLFLRCGKQVKVTVKVQIQLIESDQPDSVFRYLLHGMESVYKLT